MLTEILEREAKLPKRERRSNQRLFEELRFDARFGSPMLLVDRVDWPLQALRMPRNSPPPLRRMRRRTWDR